MQSISGISYRYSQNKVLLSITFLLRFAQPSSVLLMIPLWEGKSDFMHFACQAAGLAIKHSFSCTFSWLFAKVHLRLWSTMWAVISSLFTPLLKQKAELSLCRAEGRKCTNIKPKVVLSLASKFQGVEQILRVPFHSTQTVTGSLCGIFSAKPQGKCGGKNPPEQKNEELLMLWDNRTKPIYSVSCDISW